MFHAKCEPKETQVKLSHQDRSTPTGVVHCQSVSPYRDMSMSSPAAPSKTATDKTNLDVNAIHPFQGCMSRPEKSLQSVHKTGLPGHPDTQLLPRVPVVKFQHRNCSLLRQLSLSDLMPRLSANTLWRETPDGPSQGRCLSFWERSKSSSNG